MTLQYDQIVKLLKLTELHLKAITSVFERVIFQLFDIQTDAVLVLVLILKFYIPNIA